MDKPKTFQIVVLGIFAVLILLGLLGFSGKLPLPVGSQNIDYGTVVVWGTIPANLVDNVITEKLRNEQNITIKYVAKNKATFIADLVEGIASDKGPDVFILDHDYLLPALNKIEPISYQSIPERTFKDTFIEEGNLFMRPEGIIALPFVVDPLVMYWNRDLFDSAGIVAPPTKWSEFYTLAPRFTTRNGQGEIMQSFAPLGEYANVSHAKELLTTIMMQAGSPIVESSNGALSVNLNGVTDPGTAQSSSALAINFYTQFAKRDKDSYTWDRSLPYSRSLFESGELAVYFGYASEYMAIKQRNPHLNFDVAAMPQPDQATKKTTYGALEGLAITRSSKNPQGALRAVSILSNSDVIGGVASMMGLPPVRRDLLTVRPDNAALVIFYDAALIAQGWLDPSPTKTDALFREMIDDINSGRLRISQALGVAQNAINRLLDEYRQQ